MSYLKDIVHLYAEGNLGGVVDIKVARKRDFVFIPDAVDGVIDEDVTFATGKNWVTWRVLVESANASAAAQVSRQGTAKNNTLDFTIAKDRVDIKWMLDLAQYDELIVLYKDGNGYQKLFGNLQKPVRLQYGVDTGKQFDNLNGYTCQFYSQGVDNNCFYDLQKGALLMDTGDYILNDDGSKILL